MKAANGRSSIHRRKSGGSYEGWVSFGTDPLAGKRVRKHIWARTKAEVPDKIKTLESDRDGGYSAIGRDATLAVGELRRDAAAKLGEALWPCEQPRPEFAGEVR